MLVLGGEGGGGEVGVAVMLVGVDKDAKERGAGLRAAEGMSRESEERRGRWGRREEG
jgi:hypothetical protein